MINWLYELWLSLTRPFRRASSLALSPMPLELNTDQKDTVTVSAKTRKGNPARVPAPVSWQVSPAGVVALTPSADTLSAAVVPLDEGTATVTAAAGGLSVSDDCLVTLAPADSLVLTFGTPQ